MPDALDPRRPSQTAPDSGGGACKVATVPYTSAPSSLLQKAVTDALVSKHVCRAAANCYGKSWTLIAGLSGFLVTVIKCDIQFGFAKSVVV